MEKSTKIVIIGVSVWAVMVGLLFAVRFLPLASVETTTVKALLQQEKEIYAEQEKIDIEKSGLASFTTDAGDYSSWKDIYDLEVTRLKTDIASREENVQKLKDSFNNVASKEDLLLL